MHVRSLLFALLLGAPAAADDTLAAEVLAGGGEALRGVMAAPEAHRFQVLYAEVGASGLERHGFRADAEYFFPASSMKVPIALATYERLGAMRIGRDTPLRIEPTVTTVARDTWRALIVSDNPCANRLLGIVGHREAHETLWSLGLTSARLRTGFATGAEIDPAEVSPKIVLAGGEIPARKSDLVLPPNDARGLGVGQAAFVDGRRVAGPLSFADKNAMKLAELQDALVQILRPDILPGTTMSDDDRAHLRRALGTLPSASGIAGFDRNVVADHMLVPFLRGLERVRPRGRFEIYSKVGQAYGFLVANAYVVDKDTKKAFFLIATIYANPNEVLNDDLYAYDTVAFPVLADVGEVFLRHALRP